MAVGSSMNKDKAQLIELLAILQFKCLKEQDYTIVNECEEVMQQLADTVLLRGYIKTVQSAMEDSTGYVLTFGP